MTESIYANTLIEKGGNTMTHWMLGTIFILIVAFIVFMFGYELGRRAGFAQALAQEYKALDEEETDETNAT